MKVVYCKNCGKVTGFKRTIGIGTLLAVLITMGLWIFTLPFYPKRCIVCGLSKGEKEESDKIKPGVATIIIIVAILFFIMIYYK